jgi:hypothetical protein
MKTTLKLTLVCLSAMPMFAGAQTFLYIPSAQDHFDINGVGGGGPFNVTIENGPSMTPVNTEAMYCDSIPQEFSLGQTFQVKIELLNAGPNSIMSLDPWVITDANKEANKFDALYSQSLTTKEINSAVQGVIWELDGQLSGPLTSGDAETGQFANFLYNDAETIGTYLGGFARFDAGINYSDPNHPQGANGQSQIGAVPEPFTMTILGLGGAAILRRKRS